TISGVDVYWTGSAWVEEEDFDDAELFTIRSDTRDGQDIWVGDVDPDIDPGETDDGSIRLLAWEQGVTPALGDQILTLVWFSPPNVAAISAISLTATTGSVPYLTLIGYKTEQRAYVITVTNPSGSPISYAGKTMKCVASTFDGTWAFQANVTVSGTGNNI